MGFPKEYQYNNTIKYPVPAIPFQNDLVYRDDLPDLLTKQNLYVNDKQSFHVELENVFSETIITFRSASDVSRWKDSSDMRFYQHQLNFAIWCATAGCGVTIYRHMLEKNTPAFVKSFFRFHVYYTARRILSELKCATPSDKYFNDNNNLIDMTAYEHICSEFGVKGDFRFKRGKNEGLGSHFWHRPDGSFEIPRVYGYQDYYKFDNNDSEYHTDHLYNLEAHNCFAYFIPSEGQGFTQPGIQRLNDSIRTYVYCILGAQVQTRRLIMGQTGPSFDAQKQFIALLEDSIRGTNSIPDSINRYQNAITKSGVRLDYAIGPNLYLIPSDMIMKMGSVVNYNNNIKIASDDLSFGVNDINRPIVNEIVNEKREKDFIPKPRKLGSNESKSIESPTNNYLLISVISLAVGILNRKQGV